jgi:hypothetical protein
MATVLVSVALVAASIRIAIRMESGLDSPAARALPADTGPKCGPFAAASGTPARDRPPDRCAVPSVHPRAGPGCTTRSRPGRAPTATMIAARHCSPSAPT